MNSKHGHVFLIPVTLKEEIAPLEVLPISTKRTLENVNYFVAENEKKARSFIKKILPYKKQSALQIKILNKFTDPMELQDFLTPCFQGHHLGVLSEAGCPAVADPGASIVSLAHTKDIKVVPLVGPSSILLALMASGMNGQNFAFNGYLPINKSKRKKAIQSFEKKSIHLQQSQLFIETPYRNNKLLEDFLKILLPHTRLCIASDITIPSEYIKTKTIEEWSTEQIDLHKRPTIFIIQG